MVEGESSEAQEDLNSLMSDYEEVGIATDEGDDEDELEDYGVLC